MENPNIEEAFEKCQEYYCSQSSNVSRLSRNIIYGIIGTIWVLIYPNNTYQDSCIWIKIALWFSFIYLLLDLAHYFLDSCDYRKESHRLSHEKETTDILCRHDKTAEILYRHEERTIIIAKRSFICLKAKFFLVLVISFFFLIGVCVELGIICFTT